MKQIDNKGMMALSDLILKGQKKYLRNVRALLVALTVVLVFNYCSKESILLVVNEPPVAKAGLDESLMLPTNSVTLKGDESFDIDGSIKMYKWIKVAGPDQCIISSPREKNTEVRELTAGEYTFKLTVTDNGDSIASDDVTITVASAASPTLPSISAFTPATGLPGAAVIISGNNFIPPITVKFNGIIATVSNATTTSITTSVPVGATSGPISITSNDKNILTATNFIVSTVAPPPVAEVYFEDNMNNVTIEANSNNSNLLFKGWDALKTHPYVKEFYIDNITSDNANSNQYAYQEIVADPVNPVVKVMNAVVVDDDPNRGGTTRAQVTLGFKDGVDLSVYHTSHRMYINPDVKFIETFSSSITWFVLSEIWTKDGIASGIFSDGDVAGSARWGFTLKKEAGSGQPLFWRIRAEYMQPENIAYNGIWTYENRVTPIPFGKWFTLDIYLKRGDSSNGKYKVTMTIDGEQPIVLFDVTGSTIYPGHPELQLSAWQNFKFYLDDVYLDYMRTNNKKLSVSYNDFKWYKN